MGHLLSFIRSRSETLDCILGLGTTSTIHPIKMLDLMEVDSVSFISSISVFLVGTKAFILRTTMV